MKNYSQINISLGEAMELVMIEQKKGRFFEIKSGIRCLDILTGGWYPGELCVVGGRPAMGKTAFILNAISHIIQSGTPAALLSATDGMNLHFISRIASCLLSKENLCNEDQKVAMLKDETLQNLPLYLNLQTRLSLDFIRESCDSLVKEKGVKIIFIETIQSIFDAEPNGNSREGMERICYELKCLAEQLNVPIVISSELDRSCEDRECISGPIPRIMDLRSSSAIESKADSVYLLYRPEYYHIYQDEKGIELTDTMKIIVAKKRGGNYGDISVKFEKHNSRIYDRDVYIEEMLNR